MGMDLTKEFVNSCRKVGVLRDFLCQAIDQVDEKDKEIAKLKEQYKDMDVTHTVQIAKMNGYISHLEEERRWRKFPDEKPSEKMEGEDFLVSNGYYSVVCEWRGYWNNEPFCGDKNCDDVKYWMPLPSAPKEEQ
jgi:hypothetical protein